MNERVDEPQASGAPESAARAETQPAAAEPPPAPEPEPDEPLDPSDPSEPEPEEEGPVFDIEAFVASLPEGVCLCPYCLGMGAIIEDPPFDPYVHLCATCRGHGQLRTGALVGGEDYHECRDCQGHGWIANEPGEPPARPAEAVDLHGEAAPTDYAGRTPDDPAFDWSRITAQPAPSAPEPAVEPVAGV